MNTSIGSPERAGCDAAAVATTRSGGNDPWHAGLLVAFALFLAIHSLTGCTTSRTARTARTPGDGNESLQTLVTNTLSALAEVGYFPRSARFSAAAASRLELDDSGCLSVTFTQLDCDGLRAIERLRDRVVSETRVFRSRGWGLRTFSAVEESGAKAQPHVVVNEGHLHLVCVGAARGGCCP